MPNERKIESIKNIYETAYWYSEKKIFVSILTLRNFKVALFSCGKQNQTVAKFNQHESFVLYWRYLFLIQTLGQKCKHTWISWPWPTT